VAQAGPWFTQRPAVGGGAGKVPSAAVKTRSDAIVEKARCISADVRPSSVGLSICSAALSSYWLTDRMTVATAESDSIRRSEREGQAVPLPTAVLARVLAS